MTIFKLFCIFWFSLESTVDLLMTEEFMMQTLFITTSISLVLACLLKKYYSWTFIDIFKRPGLWTVDQWLDFQVYLEASTKDISKLLSQRCEHRVNAVRIIVKNVIFFVSVSSMFYTAVGGQPVMKYSNTLRWAWLDWGLSGWLTTLLQCFDTVGWVITPVKTVGRITYIVLAQT